MLIFDEELNFDTALFQPLDYTKEEIVYFDIETTGFSPATSSVYLIGVVYHNGTQYMMRQWFADKKESEKEIIASFIEFIKNYSALINYNGTVFDIPFIIKKCELYDIPCDFSGIVNIDIYKIINPVKNLFKLDNLKQKTIEQFMGIDRDDRYSGGDLINVYLEYLATEDSSLMRLLLLHNHDDILGMIRILPVINYTCLLNRQYDVVSVSLEDTTTISGAPKKEIIIELALDSFLPKRISVAGEFCYITAAAHTAKLCITAYTGELKYFYSNYKDYYYLPEEDESIHKSIAFYVDKNFRTRAKAANCYSKRTGVFLPQHTEVVSPYFKIDYYDKITYFEYTEEFTGSNEKILNYCNDVLNHILQK